MDAIITFNRFDEVSFEGGLGSLTLDLEDGQHQVKVDSNTFDTSGHGDWFVRADSSQSAAVLFEDNSYVRGLFECGDTDCDDGLGPPDGYFGPGEQSKARTQNGGNLDIRVDNDDFAKHDVGFIPGNTLFFEPLGGTLCVHLTDNTSPHGYGLKWGIYLTQVAPRCSMRRDGGLSAELG